MNGVRFKIEEDLMEKLDLLGHGKGEDLDEVVMGTLLI